MARLREAGFSDADIARVHSPVGLDLGAGTPEEIAIAILAEIVAVRRGRGGGSLRRPHPQQRGRVRLEALPGFSDRRARRALGGRRPSFVTCLMDPDVLLLVKGSVLSADDAPTLREAHLEVLHLLWLDEGDVGEDEAAVRISAAVAGPGTVPRPPVESQARLVSAWRGMVDVDVEALAALNTVDGVTVFTVPDGLHVDAGRTLAGVKITPLAIDARSLEQAERAARSADGAGVLSVRPFLPLRVAAIVRQHLTDEARVRFEHSLGMRSAWFGGSVEPVRYVDDSAEEVQLALVDAATAADIVLAVGVASVDPLDVTWQSVLAAGATMIGRGLPMHPGSSYWIAELPASRSSVWLHAGCSRADHRLDGG